VFPEPKSISLKNKNDCTCSSQTKIVFCISLFAGTAMVANAHLKVRNNPTNIQKSSISEPAICANPATGRSIVSIDKLQRNRTIVMWNARAQRIWAMDEEYSFLECNWSTYQGNESWRECKNSGDRRSFFMFLSSLKNVVFT
jgi:hypothetical protein